MRGRLFRLRIALLAAALVLIGPVPAQAAPTTTSNPTDGAALAAAPAQVTLTFGREPVAGESHVTVLAGDGRPVAEPARPVRAGLSLSQPVGIDQAGDYTIVYRVVFAGGGQEQGTRRFSVTTADTATGTVTDPHAAHTGHGVDPVGATLLVIDGLVVLVVVFLLMIRRPVAWRLPKNERKPDDRTA
jgi:methionine-rich copper-binding protein CopC